ncbi:MAG: lactate utilization protein [Oscillospiraceae bacterium]|nr:lactate utilization protein [Oscillospiraceae bacterium]
MANVARTVENLKQRGFHVSQFSDRESAAQYLLSEVGAKSVGIGGAITIKELDIYPRLTEQCDVYWHWEQGKEVFPQAYDADVYLMSANGVSESGQIINIDGSGNRVRSMCFGHERLYIVIGTNKIAVDDEAAMWRARNVASPLNVRRLGKNTPCAVGEVKCHDCNAEERICRVFVTLEQPPAGIGHVEVVIVDEALGY